MEPAAAKRFSDLKNIYAKIFIDAPMWIVDTDHQTVV